MVPAKRVTSRCLRSALPVLLLLQAGHGIGFAQTVYQWTDDRGVIHFSQNPPPAGQAEVTLMRMPVAPPEPEGADEAETTPAPAAGAQTPGSDSQVARPTGPAKVEISKQSARQVDAAVRAFRGSVKNTGGQPALDVVVEIVVTETAQGAECLRSEIDVVPSELKPGAIGTYDAEFENPCFYGDTKVDIRTDWEEE